MPPDEVVEFYLETNKALSNQISYFYILARYHFLSSLIQSALLFTR